MKGSALRTSRHRLVLVVALMLCSCERKSGTYTTNTARYTWQEGHGESRVVTGEVLTADGRPVPNAIVEVDDRSSTTAAGTHIEGRFSVQMNEPEVAAVGVFIGEREVTSIDFRKVLRRKPSCRKGLHLKVVLLVRTSAPAQAPTDTRSMTP